MHYFETFPYTAETLKNSTCAAQKIFTHITCLITTQIHNSLLIYLPMREAIHSYSNIYEFISMPPYLCQSSAFISLLHSFQMFSLGAGHNRGI